VSRVPVVLLVAAAGAAFVTILLLGRPLTFRADEWAFITSRSLADPVGWFAPHGSHLMAVPVVLFRVLVETVGLTSYLPYLALLAALHLAVAIGLFVALRRDVGDWLALAAAVVVLFLGYGYENLFWAFQIGYVGGIAAGLSGLIALRAGGTGRAAVASAVLFTVAIASTLTGAVLLGAAWVESAFVPRDRRRRAAVLALPTALLAAWWLVARPSVGHLDQPLATDAGEILQFVGHGLAHAFGALTGIGAPAGALLGLGLLATIAVRARNGGIPAETTGAAAGLVAFFVLAALSRGVLGIGAAASPRYLYFGVVLAVLAIAPLLQGVDAPAGPRRRLAIVVVLVLFEIALIGNVRLLAPGRDELAREALAVRSEFALLDDPAARPTTSAFVYRTWTPIPRQLIELRARYGDLRQAGGDFWDPPPIPEAVLDRVRRAMATDEVEQVSDPIVP
jgi:hypothetical protein